MPENKKGRLNKPSLFFSEFFTNLIIRLIMILYFILQATLGWHPGWEQPRRRQQNHPSPKSRNWTFGKTFWICDHVPFHILYVNYHSSPGDIFDWALYEKRYWSVLPMATCTFWMDDDSANSLSRRMNWFAPIQFREYHRHFSPHVRAARELHRSRLVKRRAWKTARISYRSRIGWRSNVHYDAFKGYYYVTKYMALHHKHPLRPVLVSE